MEISAIFLLLAVTVFVALFIARPSLEAAGPGYREDHEKSVLLAEQERILTALAELDADQQLGKIPEQDYQPQRSLLVQRGADVIRQLDAFQESIPAPRRKPAAGGAKRKTAAATPAAIDDDSLEDMLARRRAALREKTAGFCPGCGKPVLKSDKFCPSCGRAVN